MQLTDEQQAIIASEGDITVNAVAGSGKTTTVVEYAKARPTDSRMLYLAFNRAVKQEAIRKFDEAGLNNVEVRTAHSLAYRSVVGRSGYQVRPFGYKTHEVVDLLSLSVGGERHAEYVAANHIKKFMAYFCNSSARKVQELDYRRVVTDEGALKFVEVNYETIEWYTRLLLAKMNRGDIEITHDFYLKKFQLARPQLPYDYILFDEGQDASPVMLDIVFQQPATKVVVGDTHQQIYGWRYAVNSLEKASYSNYALTNSFRFSQDIADLAVQILDWKDHLREYQPVAITGHGPGEEDGSRAVLGRTNLGLLLNAIETVTEDPSAHIYFEGNINTYTYADEGASLYDVLNLYNGNTKSIRDKLIRQMQDLDDLEEYIEQTEDMQLSMMVEIVKEYGNDIPGLIRLLKERHVEDDDRDKADIVFSTVHRCKGMEYDRVELVKDFLSEDKLQKVIKDHGKENVDIAKLNEEINLLYVAVTRTKQHLTIPEELLPIDFPESEYIKVVQTEAHEPLTTVTELEDFEAAKRLLNGDSYSIENARSERRNAYQRWNSDEEDKLTEQFESGASIPDLAETFGRTEGAIRSRLKKLALVES